MKTKTVISNVAFSLSLLSISGCSGPLVRSAITSNIVQEEAHNSYLVLNIARAYERMPMHFTQVNAVRATPGGFGIGTPSLGLEVPFGGASTPAYKLSPSLESSSSVDTVSLVSQEFMRGITTPIDGKLLAYFINQGWPTSMVMHLFVGSVETYDSNGKILHNLVNNPANASFDKFNKLVNLIAECKLVLSETPDYDFYGDKLSLKTLTDPKSLAAAKTAGLTLVDVDDKGDPIKKESEKPAKAPNKGADRFVRLAKVTQESRFSLESYASQNTGVQIDTRGCVIDGALSDMNKQPIDELPIEEGKRSELSALFNDITRAIMERKAIPVNGQKRGNEQRATERQKEENRNDHSGIAEVRFVLRSTQSMIYYLGEVSRYQNRPGEKKKIRVRVGNAESTREKYAYLFNMSCCEQADNSAVSVQYHKRQYSVANFAEGTSSALEDRSVQTLALLSLVYTLQNQSGEPPAIRNVRVIP